MDWQALKETSWKWTQRIALYWLAQSSLLYLWACVVAGRPITPIEMVRFCNHMIQWRMQRAATGNASVVLAGASDIPHEPAREATRYTLPLPAQTWTNRKVEIMNGRLASAGVVAVLDAGTPVRVKDYFVDGSAKVEEIVQDGSHPPAHGRNRNI